MAVTAEQIRAWIASNPNASTAEIESAMQTNGVSAQMLASVLGTQPLLNAPAEVQTMQFNNWSANAPRLTTDANRALVMQRFGLTPEEAGQYSSIPQAQIQQRYDAGLAQAAAPITRGAVTDQQIATYLAGNPQANDEALFSKMTEYGVTPEQMARVSGVNVSDIDGRILAVKQAGAQNIPTGLMGYQESINKGLADTAATIRNAEILSRRDLTDSQAEVARLYGRNIEGIQQAGTAAASDLTAAQAEVAKLYGLNIEDIQAAGTRARSDVERTFGTAGSYFTPYQQAGTQALTMQQALSGASGQQAFNQAYQESPYIAFLREQGMRANLAGASATGGLGGGNVQKELQRFGQGLASQGIQQQIGNLQNLSGQGFNAATSAANIQNSMGTNLANLGTATAGDIAGQRSNLAGSVTNTGTNLANLRTGTAANVAQQGGSLAGYVSGTGLNLANIGQTAGANIANIQSSAASGIAQQRMTAGQALQAQIDAATINLANLASAQGTNISNQYGKQTAAVQDLNLTAAGQYAADEQNLAGEQANMITGQQFYQAPAPDYGRFASEAFGAAQAGYDLGGMMGQPKPPPPPVPTFDTNYRVPTLYTPPAGGQLQRATGSPLTGSYPNFIRNY